MSENIFGWDLPPGCSAADIERACGDEGIVEAFDRACSAGQVELSKEAMMAWGTQAGAELIEQVLEWAYRAGYQARSLEAEEEYFYREMHEKEKGQ